MEFLSLPDALINLFESRLYNAFTGIPAQVTQVDYAKAYVSVLPLIENSLSSKKTTPYPEIPDVPLYVMSANGTSARITIPVKVGDIVALHYSHRDTEPFRLSDGSTVTKPERTTPLGDYPLYAVASLNSLSRSKAIDPNNIVIENGSTDIVIEPSGKVKVNCTDYTVKCQNYLVDCNTYNVTGSSANFDTGSLTHNNVDVGDTHYHTQGIDSDLNSQVPTDPPVR